MPLAKTLLILWTLCSGQPEWKDWHLAIEAKYETYAQDNQDGDWQKYLNRETTNKLASFKRTEPEIREVLFLVSMYHEKDVELPKVLVPFVQRFGDSLYACVLGEIKEGK